MRLSELGFWEIDCGFREMIHQRALGYEMGRVCGVWTGAEDGGFYQRGVNISKYAPFI